ncbi:MAG: hypothetical protein KatS3mg013_0492 [Actinomycetota bacterium]|nr:MAG: hypothetical protein KatS3mg013_0492 [Actinomycetota bacterium]
MSRIYMRGHCGPWWAPVGAYPGYGYVSREDHIRFLEEHQRDLEQELADVPSEIRRLKENQSPESARG